MKRRMALIGLLACTVVVSGLSMLMRCKHHEHELTAVSQHREVPRITITEKGILLLEGKPVTATELEAAQRGAR